LGFGLCQPRDHSQRGLCPIPDVGAAKRLVVNGNGGPVIGKGLGQCSGPTNLGEIET
jgi:hypothetical protein